MICFYVYSSKFSVKIVFMSLFSPFVLFLTYSQKYTDIIDWVVIQFIFGKHQMVSKNSIFYFINSSKAHVLVLPFLQLKHFFFCCFVLKKLNTENIYFCFCFSLFFQSSHFILIFFFCSLFHAVFFQFFCHGCVHSFVTFFHLTNFARWD